MHPKQPHPLKLIVAMDQQRGIGRNNDLMWHLPADMQFFKESTKGQIVIMGRKNYDSIPEKFRPLPGRLNVVLSRQPGFEAAGCAVYGSLTDALDHLASETERSVFIIGGGQIYREALENDLVDVMYITHVHKSYGADTFFPEINETQWEVESLFSQNPDERHEAGFEVKKYTRKQHPAI